MRLLLATWLNSWKFTNQPNSYALLLILPFYVFPLCTCTRLVKDLFLFLNHLSVTVSLAKLGHLAHSHLSSFKSHLLRQLSSLIDSVSTCVCVCVCVCVCDREIQSVCVRVCVHVWEIERECGRESVCLCLCLCMGMHVCVCVCVCVCSCVSVCVFTMSPFFFFKVRNRYSSITCCILLNRWISSRNITVFLRNIFWSLRAILMVSFTSLTPHAAADRETNLELPWRRQLLAMILANVVYT